MRQITLMNDGVLMCRVGGIYNLIERKDYKKATEVINDTIKLFRTVVEKDIDRELEKYAVQNLYYALIKLATHHYVEAHKHITDVHFAIEGIY